MIICVDLDRTLIYSTDALDLREDMTSLYVHAVRATGGVVDVPHTIDVERG